VGRPEASLGLLGHAGEERQARVEQPSRVGILALAVRDHALPESAACRERAVAEGNAGVECPAALRELAPHHLQQPELAEPPCDACSVALTAQDVDALMAELDDALGSAASHVDGAGREQRPRAQRRGRRSPRERLGQPASPFGEVPARHPEPL
jgi:hypothetical protein